MTDITGLPKISFPKVIPRKTVLSVADILICLSPEYHTSARYSDRFIRKIAGDATNSLTGLSRLGFDTRIITELSGDAFGQYIRHYLAGEGIRIYAPETINPTPLYIKETLVDGSVRVSYHRSKTAAAKLPFSAIDLSALDGVDVFLYSGIFPALSAENTATMHNLIQQPQIKCALKVFDPNIRFKLFQDAAKIPVFMKDFISHCDILMIGEYESQTIFGTTDPEAIYKEAEKLGVRHIVIKMGELGSIIIEDEKKQHVVPVKPHRVIDTCGAGDAFNCGYILGCLLNLNAEQRGLLASVIASCIIQSYSDNENYPYRNQLETLIASTGRQQSMETAESMR